MMTVILFFVLLSVLVLAHEFGHFLVARLSGVKAEEFGFGFNTRLAGFVKEHGKWKQIDAKDQKAYASTIWSINWLPLGGFVRMKGEEGNFHDADSFVGKGWFARGGILAAGVFMNWILAAVIFSIGFLVGVPSDLEGVPSAAIIRDARVQITNVLKDSGADQAGLESGDYLLKIEGKEVKTVQEAQALAATNAQAHSSVAVTVQREREIKEMTVVPQEVTSLNRKA